MKYVLKISFLVLCLTTIAIFSLRQLGFQKKIQDKSSWFEKERKYWLIAQGGGGGLGPGHSKEAFRRVKELSSEIVLEIELKRTLDGQWLLYGHDRLEVQTEGEGFISWKKWSEIKNLNLGFYFKNKKGEFSFRNKRKKLNFIKFEDFIKNYKKPFLLKIRLRDTYGFGDLIKIIEKHKAQNQVVISADSMASYKYLKTQRPQWRFVSSLSEIPFVLMMESLYLEPLIKVKEPVFLSPLKIGGRKVFSPSLIKELKRQKKKIFVQLDKSSPMIWPVFAQGVITLYPDKFLALLKTLNNKNKRL